MRKFEESGGLYRWSFAELISEDGLNLAMSDAVMVGSTLLCVPFVKVSRISTHLVSFYVAD